MKIGKIRCASVAILLLTFLSPLIFAANEGGASKVSGQVYVSFLWAGKSDTDCLLRDTLLTDTVADCEKEYLRAETEIKDMVKRRNERGGGWKWGTFAKCSVFPDTDSYSRELDKLRKRCMGK